MSCPSAATVAGASQGGWGHRVHRRLPAGGWHWPSRSTVAPTRAGSGPTSSGRTTSGPTTSRSSASPVGWCWTTSNRPSTCTLGGAERGALARQCRRGTARGKGGRRRRPGAIATNTPWMEYSWRSLGRGELRRRANGTNTPWRGCSWRSLAVAAPGRQPPAEPPAPARGDARYHRYRAPSVVRVEGGGYPTEPSMLSSISRDHSTAYSMGRVRVTGSMKPLTIMPIACCSERPRLIR
ncbi:MAG: hypothetical protein QOI99_922 [Actinomycetota bacterium]|nr:hypothetical protein [Actinomycetota bacterium]